MSGRRGGDLEAFRSSEIFEAAKVRFGDPKTLEIHPIAAYPDRRVQLPVLKTVALNCRIIAQPQMLRIE